MPRQLSLLTFGEHDESSLPGWARQEIDRLHRHIVRLENATEAQRLNVPFRCSARTDKETACRHQAAGTHERWGLPSFIQLCPKHLDRFIESQREMQRQHADRLAEQREAREREQRSRSVVYFVEREGLIKIGTTTNLTKRLKDISKGSSMPDGMTVGPVELLATTPGDRDLEGRLHRQFDEYRVGRSEWFKPGPPVLRLVARFQRRTELQSVA